MERLTLRSRTAGLVGALALVAAATIVSCATLRQLSFEQPSVELDAVEISGLDLDGVSLILWLDVYNPNEYEIRTTRVEADLDLEETHFGSAALDESVPLAAASHTRVKLPATFRWEGVGAAARALLGRGTVDYDLETRLRVQTSLGGRTLSLRRRGEVQVKDLVR
ncbi:MAG: LEA type 2 family protein [Gemmatimonadales bacterium]|jgi:LEA14-like dessication related protein